jgi:hypothetical protein
VVPAIDDGQRCVSLLQAFFKLQIDETTKGVVLVTLLISINCIHRLIGFVSLSSKFNAQIYFHFCQTSTNLSSLMTDASYVVDIPVGSGTILSFMTLSCTLLSCG